MKKIVLALFLTAAALSATAQEFILQPQEIKDNRSVTREVIKNVWLTANYYEGNRMGAFFLNNSIPSNTNRYDAGYLVVHDLEVLSEHAAFYCGERYNYRCYQIGLKDSSIIPEDTLYTIISYDTMGNYVYVKRARAVMGYFQMDLDNLTLYDFHEVADFRYYLFRCFNKLELLPVSDGIHVLMTGTTKWGNGSLLDAVFHADISLWKLYIDTTNDGTLFDDVAVTSKEIVASLRHPLTGMASLDYHTLPTSVTTSTIGGYTAVALYSYSANDEILLEHCEQDAFASATYSQGENKIMISGFVSAAYIGTVSLPLYPTMDPRQQLIDIKYDSTSRVLALLQHFLENVDTSSVIWHLLPGLIPNSGGWVDGALYSKEVLSSIDRLKYLPGHFIASGHKSGYAWLVRLYQHKIGLMEQCRVGIFRECTLLEHKTNDISRFYPELSENVEPQIFFFDVYPYSVKYICLDNENGSK